MCARVCVCALVVCVVGSVLPLGTCDVSHGFSIVEFVNASEDPFSKSYTGTNPYTTDQGGGCACAIM